MELKSENLIGQGSHCIRTVDIEDLDDTALDNPLNYVINDGRPDNLTNDEEVSGVDQGFTEDKLGCNFQMVL